MQRRNLRNLDLTGQCSFLRNYILLVSSCYFICNIAVDVAYFSLGYWDEARRLLPFAQKGTLNAVLTQKYGKCRGLGRWSLLAETPLPTRGIVGDVVCPLAQILNTTQPLTGVRRAIQVQQFTLV